MDLSSLSSFLSSSKRNLDSLGVGKTFQGDIHVVLCNESADLDSVVSCIVTGYYIAHSIYKEEKENNEEPHSVVFSVINCSREDFPIRTEAIFWLKENGIDQDQLICRDEINLNEFLGSGKLNLTLVDHNVLAHADTHLAPSIQRVIDHHKRDKAVDRRDTIETVGSCCTLVGEIVLGLFSNDPIVCRLLYGTIVLDTYNFSAAAQRTTGKDLKVVQELEDAISASSNKQRPNNSEIFKALAQARADISQLTPHQLLRKDLKVLRLPEITIAIPAVPMLSQQLLELPNMIENLKLCMQSQNCNIVVILCYRVGELNGEIKKDVIVFSDSLQKAKQICSLLENSELDLRLIRSSADNQSSLFVYQQGNVTLSRKFVLPFLVKHFEARATNNQTSLDMGSLSGGELLIPGIGDAGAVSPNKFVASPLPSISYTAVQSLGLGDPISQSGSSQNSAYNSCPYTPQNSCSEPVDGLSRENYFLPSFNSREMIEKIELKRGKLRGYEKGDDELKPNPSSYPFTPKNSYVESNLEAVFEQSQPQMRNMGRDQQGYGVLHAIDSDLLLRKLMEKQRQPGTGSVSYYSSSNSSKSQSLTKLNVDEFVFPGDPLGSPNQAQTPPVAEATHPMDIPQFKRYN